LDLAVQCATTEMVRWLMEDYGLSLEAANVLMSQSVEYEMGNLVSSNFTAVCKLSKSIIRDALAD
jgi:acetamidase/formamidase